MAIRPPSNQLGARKTEYAASKQYGGAGGDTFDDKDHIDSKVKSITLQGGNRLDAIAITLDSGKVLRHGGGGGKPYTHTLEEGDYFNSAKVCWYEYAKDPMDAGHSRIFFANITTKAGRYVAAGKIGWSICETITAPDRTTRIAGALGRAKLEVDKLGFYFS